MKIAANRESWRNFGIFAPFCKNGSSRIARKRSTIPPFLVLEAIYKKIGQLEVQFLHLKISCGSISRP